MHTRGVGRERRDKCLLHPLGIEGRVESRPEGGGGGRATLCEETGGSVCTEGGMCGNERAGERRSRCMSILVRRTWASRVARAREDLNEKISSQLEGGEDERATHID